MIIVKKLLNVLITRPFLKFFLSEVGRNFRFGYGGNLETPEAFSIGDDFFTGPYPYFSSNRHTKVIIGDKVMFGPRCMVIAGNHNIQDPSVPMLLAPKLFEQDRGIVIEDDVWVGASAAILDGAFLSEGTVVAAGAVINCKTMPYAVYGGVPARFIKFRFSKKCIAKLKSKKYSTEQLMKMYENE